MTARARNGKLGRAPDAGAALFWRNGYVKDVTVYTTRYCPYCTAAKDLLRSKKIPFREIDVSDDDEFDALVERTGWKTVPQIFVDNDLIGGFQELRESVQSGNFDKLLK